MIALLQRVSEAEVSVADESVARIGPGVLALIGIERGDTSVQGDALARRLLTLRLFDDADGRMNLDVAQTGGEVLLVSQFTLAADTRKGRRPGFSTAAAPERARELFDRFVQTVRAAHPATRTGRFGAHMRVALVNDGPVTFRLQVAPACILGDPPTAPETGS